MKTTRFLNSAIRPTIAFLFTCWVMIVSVSMSFGQTTVEEWGYWATQYAIPAGLTNVVSVAMSADYSSSLALNANGTVVGWGNAGTVPAGLSNVVAVAAGEGYGLALTINGTVVAWGGYGLGETNVPPGLSNVIAIAAGDSHSLALKNDGTVAEWGDETNVPAGLTNIVAIAAGHDFDLTLDANGNITGWGNVQLDPPPGLTNVVAISAGGLGALALSSDGTVTGLGIFNFSSNTVPYGLTSQCHCDPSVVAISISEGIAVAVHNDGSVQPWGDNSYSQQQVSSLTNVLSIIGGEETFITLTGPRPTNDNFANRALITGASNTVSGNMLGATIEPGEPNPGGGSLWWTWTAPSNATVFLQATSLPFFHGLCIYAYTGNSLGNLVSVIQNTNFSRSANVLVKFAAQAGNTYQFAVESSLGATVRDFTLSLSTAAPPPANDNFTNSTVINALSYTNFASNTTATREPGEPDHGTPVGFPPYDPDGGEGMASVWWQFTAPVDGLMDVTVLSTNLVPLIAVYQGQSVSNLSVVTKNTGSFGQSFTPYPAQDYVANDVQFTAASNNTYYIAVDGYAQTTGQFIFAANFTPALMNNNFADAIALAPNFTNINGSNLGASGGTSWWSWTAPRAHPITFTTCGSSFNTSLSVYTNSSGTNLTLIANNISEYSFNSDTGPNDDPASRVTFNAAGGTTYYISVSTAFGPAGYITLNNVTVAIDEIISSETNVLADDTTAFTNVLDVANLGTTTTGSLRIRMMAQPGYSYLQALQNDQQFLGQLKGQNILIGVTNLPGAGTLAVGTSTQIAVSGICPAPTYSQLQTTYDYAVQPGGNAGFSLGIGYSVLAILEEEIGGVWVPQDSRLILTGDWPTVGGFEGPGGGVITLAASPIGSSPAVALLDVSLGPPVAVRTGGAWRVSPTNYGNAGELRAYTNYVTNTSTSLSVQSTNFTIEQKSIAGFMTNGIPNLKLTAGNITALNISYSVVPPRLIFNKNQGLGITGTSGTKYLIQTASKLPATNWTLLSTNILAAGTNWITNTLPIHATNHFYRAIWVTN